MPGPYKYPLTDESRFGRARIEFSAMEVIPPEFVAPGAVDKLTGGVENVFKVLFSDNKTGTKLSEKNAEQIAKNNRTGYRGLNVTAIDGEKVSLHIQNPFIVDDALNYGNANLGVSGASTLAGLQGGAGAVGSAAQGILDAGKGILGLFEAGEGNTAVNLAIVRAAQSVAGTFLGQGIRSAVGLAAGVTVNPNLRTTFEGVGIRQFSFQFKFIPKSPEEAQEVKKIIRFFRFHAYPEEILLGDVIPVGYKYPNMFKIKLKYADEGNKTFVNIGTPIKMSYLRTVQAVYNPTQQQFHEDGMPTEIDMTLAFSEYKTLSRKDVFFEDEESFYDINPKQSRANNKIFYSNPNFAKQSERTSFGGGGR